MISNIQIKVSTDLNELRKRLKDILPNEKIEVRSTNDGIVLHRRVSTSGVSDKAVLLANRYAPNLVSNLIDVENLTSKALITQTYTIETDYKFFKDLFTGSENSAVEIVSTANAQFSSILSKMRSSKTKTKSYTFNQSNQIKFFVGGALSYPYRDGDMILIKNFKNRADIAIGGKMINDKDGAIRLNINIIKKYVSEDESLLPDVTSVFETQVKNSRHTVTIENGSSLILIVAPKALNLKHNLGKQAQKQTQFFNKRDIKDGREIYAVHVTLSDMK